MQLPRPDRMTCSTCLHAPDLPNPLNPTDLPDLLNPPNLPDQPYLLVRRTSATISKLRRRARWSKM